VSWVVKDFDNAAHFLDEIGSSKYRLNWRFRGQDSKFDFQPSAQREQNPVVAKYRDAVFNDARIMHFSDLWMLKCWKGFFNDILKIQSSGWISDSIDLADSSVQDKLKENSKKFIKHLVFQNLVLELTARVLDEEGLGFYKPKCSMNYILRFPEKVSEFSDFIVGAEIDDPLSGISRHLGMPSNLLDWTVDPLVASFMASFGCRHDAIDSGEKIAVYAIDSTREFDLYSPSRAVTSQHRFLSFQFYTSARSLNPLLSKQRGLFSYLAGERLFYILEDGFPSVEDCIGIRYTESERLKFTLPKSECAELLKLLRESGITTIGLEYPKIPLSEHVMALDLSIDEFLGFGRDPGPIKYVSRT